MRWLECEELYLTENWNQIPIKQIVKSLGRTEIAIQSRARKLKLGASYEVLQSLRRKNVKWTKDMECKLLQLYGTVPNAQLALMFGCSHGAITVKAFTLKQTSNLL